MTNPLPVPPETQVELEAAAFRRLLAHLGKRTDAQNIDLMNLAGFCRNCLANWLVDAASERRLPLTKDQAREYVYQMPYEEWRTRYQIEASEDQKAKFTAVAKPHEH